MRPQKFPMAVFEEPSRLDLCFNCVSGFHLIHRCLTVSIKYYIRRRIQRGESAVRMVSNLVICLEE